MARRIRMIPPFADATGNISGDQQLKYASNDNPAFDAPTGRQYAKNYTARYIGFHVAKTGKYSFQVKTKSATKIDETSKLTMALLGGTAAVRAAILANPTYKLSVLRAYEYGIASGQIESGTSSEKWMYNVINQALLTKSVMINFFVTGMPAATFQNPWVYRAQPGGQPLTIKKPILVKFWMELALNPITYRVQGMKGVAHLGDDFNAVLSLHYNVLGLVTQTVGNTEYIKYGEGFIYDPEDDYVTEETVLENDKRYILKFDAPEP